MTFFLPLVILSPAIKRPVVYFRIRLISVHLKNKNCSFYRLLYVRFLIKHLYTSGKLWIEYFGKSKSGGENNKSVQGLCGKGERSYCFAIRYSNNSKS